MTIEHLLDSVGKVRRKEVNMVCGINTFHHLGMVTRDLPKTVDAYERWDSCSHRCRFRSSR